MNQEEVIFMLQHNNMFEEAYMTGEYANLEELRQKPSYISLFGSRNVNEVYGEYVKYFEEGADKVILKCKCKHDFQDERYGKQQRVHNKANKASGTDQHAYRCTVCSNVQMVSAKK